MVSTQRKQSEFNIFLLIFAFVCLILFWTSRNSYTHDFFTNIDNAWYFTCGKSWMLGLQPYLDFADSKGPLLWLIYGIGYLVSPQSYISVFWLECLFSATTLFFMYKTAKCLSGKTCLSLAATLASSLFLYNALHFETKAEDFSLPFIAASRAFLRRFTKTSSISNAETDTTTSTSPEIVRGTGALAPL